MNETSNPSAHNINKQLNHKGANSKGLMTHLVIIDGW